MNHVKAPAQLLLDPSLPVTAKLLWMIIHLHAGPLSPSRLSNLSGLARQTVRASLHQLKTTGWLDARPTARHALVPAGLLADRRIGPRGKVLYAQLQLAEGFCHPSLQCRYQHLADLIGISPGPVRQAARHLAETGWLETTRRSKKTLVLFTLRDPIAEQRAAVIAIIQRRLAKAEFKGEAIMREFLSLIVASEEFEDNASPGYLRNPFTGEPLQLDRYYPPGVAFEYNGLQHYTTTEHYPSEERLRRQQARDYMKRGICEARGIRLITLHAEELTLDRIRQAVDGLLPLRDLAGHEDLIAFLEDAARTYRRRARPFLPLPTQHERPRKA